MRLSEKKKDIIKKMNEAFAYAVRDDESMELPPVIQVVADVHTATLINMLENEDDDMDMLDIASNALFNYCGEEEDADEDFVDFDADDEEDFNDFCKWLFEE